jgi:hypothetical protein
MTRMSVALANRLNLSPTALRLYQHVARRCVHAIVKKAISSYHFSNISFAFLTPLAKMVDILPQMQEAFKNGPIARKVSTSTYPIHKTHRIHATKSQ